MSNYIQVICDFFILYLKLDNEKTIFKIASSRAIVRVTAGRTL